MFGAPTPQPGLFAQYWPHACALFVAFLGFVVLGPNSDVVAYGSFPPAGPARNAGTLVTGRGFVRTDVYLPSGDPSAPRLHGWWYRPKSAKYSEQLPTILMASGLGAQVGLCKPFAMLCQRRCTGMVGGRAFEVQRRSVPRLLTPLPFLKPAYKSA